ncbi:hypothetical protein C8R42DRAFT_726258 [Lentinula raphanica]|nr:hypothetical protein C8R42DRAFT_726258 [Lentinula raphanica]
MRFNIVLLLGLVSATYALPNPGLRHFQPRSDTEAEPDPQPAVGNHTFGLMPRAPISSDSAFDDGHWPFFDPGIVATYHFIESLERTNPLRSEMEGNWDYVSRLSHWSTDLIGRRLFGHKGVTAMFYDQPVPPYEPRKWNWQLSTENAAVVIDRRTQEWVGWMSETDARNLHDQSLVVVSTPTIGEISLSDNRVRVAFCQNDRNRRPIRGAKFDIPWDESSDKAIVEEYRAISRTAARS